MGSAFLASEKFRETGGYFYRMRGPPLDPLLDRAIMRYVT